MRLSKLTSLYGESMLDSDSGGENVALDQNGLWVRKAKGTGVLQATPMVGEGQWYGFGKARLDAWRLITETYKWWNYEVTRPFQVQPG